MKILVTGAEGFVASNLIPQLLDQHEVIALDYINSVPLNISDDVRFVNTDLSQNIPKIDDDLDLVIHLATINQLAISSNPRLVNINTLATHNALELATRKKAQFMFSSSCSVYGNGLDLKEDMPTNPQSLYAVGKCYEEQMVKFYAKKYDVNAIILRFSNCYGDITHLGNKIYPGKKDVSRIFMENIIGGKSIPLIRGLGRDYTYIGDVVNAIMSTIKLTSGLYTFNVGTGVETLTEFLLITMAEILKMPITIEECPPRDTDDIIHRSLNCSKIISYTDWEPKVKLKEGLKKYAQNMLSQPTRSSS